VAAPIAGSPALEAPDTTDGGQDGPEPGAEPGRRGYRDLLLMALLSTLGLLLTDAPPLVRALLGPVTVLLVPGYAAVSALFPRDDDLDRIERLGLSLSTSLAMIAAVGLALDRIPGGLTFPAIRVAVTGGALLLLGVAALRRARAGGAPPARAAEGPPDAPAPTGRAVRFTQAIVVANIAVAALAYVVTIGATVPTSTALYVLGDEEKIADYPTEVAVGESFAVTVGGSQASNASGRYRLTATSGDAVLATLGPVDLPAGGTWQSEVRVALPRAGPDQELELNLARDGDSEPFRTVRLWVDVRADR
jgi:uncharacterized membrane protein